RLISTGTEYAGYFRKVYSERQSYPFPTYPPNDSPRCLRGPDALSRSPSCTWASLTSGRWLWTMRHISFSDQETVNVSGRSIRGISTNRGLPAYLYLSGVR